MKTTIKHIFFLVIAGIFTFGFVNNNDEKTPIALIKKVVKDVSHKADDASDWELAKTGIPLNDGEEVKTGYKSLALILFTDGTGLVRVRENTRLFIYGEEEDRKVSKNTYIDKGVVGFDINKQEYEEFKFTTPTAVAAIRGTSGYIEVGNDSSTTIVCEKGSIEVQSLKGDKETSTVEAGTAATVDPNGMINKGTMSSSQANKYKMTKKYKSNKIRIETEEGTIEIEYYPEEE